MLTAFRSVIIAALLTCFVHDLDAGAVSLTRSPLSPSPRTIQAGFASQESLSCFRIAGTQGVSRLLGFHLATGGTASWDADLDAVDGVVVAAEAGNDSFGNEDIVLWQGSGVPGVLQVVFQTPLLIPANSWFDLWIVVRRTASAGTQFGETLVASIAVPGDVLVDASDSVVFGVPGPEGSELSIAQFHVGNVYPLRGHYDNLTLEGFGFSLPFSVRVGPYECVGLPVINRDGTRVEGLQVAGFDWLEEYRDQEIRVSSGTVVDYLVPFRYTQESAKPPESGCSVAGDGTAALVMLLLLCASLAWSLGCVLQGSKTSRQSSL